MVVEVVVHCGQHHRQQQQKEPGSLENVERKKAEKKGKKNKTKQQKNKTNKTKRTEMRTQEQKQYDENGKYIHKCMKQNCNREETEGEELTASGRGGLSLQKVRWLQWHRGRATGFHTETPACLVLAHLYGASLYELIALRVVLHFWAPAQQWGAISQEV